MLTVAARVAAEQSSADDRLWRESSGPGSFRWYWARTVDIAPVIAGVIGIVMVIAGIIGWVIGVEWLSGGYLKGPPFTAAGLFIVGAMSLAMLLMREKLRGGAAERAGRAFAGLAFVVSALIIIHSLSGHPLVDWDHGPWREPAPSGLAILLLLAFGMLVLDLDPPRYRWQSTVIWLAGVLLLLVIFTRGFRDSTLIGDSRPAFSYSGALCAMFLYFGYVCVRPQRELTRFITAAGPGPSLARLLVPLAVLIPLLFGAMGAIARNLSPEHADALRGIEGLVVMVLLIGIVIFASRRLQGYYEGWKQANAEITSQANVLSGMAEGVCVSRLNDLKIVLTNPQFDAMHGWGRGELLGHRLDELAPDDLTPVELDERERVGEELVREGSSRYENRSIRRDGKSIWCRSNAIVGNDPTHGPVMILVKTDVTGEIQAREARGRAEDKFRQVFEQSPIGLCLVRENGSFEKVNASFERIVGYTGAELSDRTFADITHPDDLARDLELTQLMFAGKSDGFTMEKRYIRKDGEVVWIFLTVVMMKSRDGQPDQALSMIEDVTERREMSMRLRYMADHDPLTGLFNRRRFEQELERAVDGPEGTGLAVLAIDLDNFKFINDSYGHAVGDRLIVCTAEMLRDSLRSQDVLARQGGDEFVVILRDIGPDDAVAKAEELVGAIADQVRVAGPDFSARVTASIGVAVGGADGEDMANLLMSADIAMYEAKDAGRNGTRLFNPEEDSQVTQGIDWAARLRDALNNDSILLYAQPVVDLRGGGVPQFELLIRLPDPNGGIIGPGAFLPIAERYDLVQEIDRWVIRRAIQTLADLSRDGRRVCLGVNLSGRTVGDPRLSRFLQEQLEETDVDPSCLIFEVTETSAIGNITRAQEFAARLSEFGCGFALDDFGTGFASFYYLKHIASDIVKIDGEFVRNLASDPVNQLLVRALVQIAKGMGKLTVAEQVEDPTALDLLHQYGVDFAQGYYLGRPAPVEETDFGWIPELPPSIRAGGGR